MTDETPTNPNGPYRTPTTPEDRDVVVLFSTSNHLLSRMIRWLTKSPVSHCAIRICPYGVPMVFQASVGGVQPMLESAWLKKNTVIKKFLVLPDVSTGVAKAIGMLNASYDYLALFGFLVVWWEMRRGRKVKNPLASPNMVVCSEFLLHVDADDKIPEWNDFEWESTFPSQLMVSCKESFRELPV